MVTKTEAGEVKCVVVGDGGVGKTSMMLRYNSGKILTDHQPTCFDSYQGICLSICILLLYELNN